MRKLLIVAAISLAGVGLSTGTASAWLFSKKCCAGSATLCIKPYNAFSPTCFGTIACDGCFPVGMGGQGMMGPWGGGGYGAGCGPMGCMMDGGMMGPDCCGEVVVPSAPANGAGEGSEAVGQPMPQPLPTGQVNLYPQMWPRQMPVQAAGYRPMYYPPYPYYGQGYGYPQAYPYSYPQQYGQGYPQGYGQGYPQGYGQGYPPAQMMPVSTHPGYWGGMPGR